FHVRGLQRRRRDNQSRLRRRAVERQRPRLVEHRADRADGPTLAISGNAGLCETDRFSVCGAEVGSLNGNLSLRSLVSGLSGSVTTAAYGTTPAARSTDSEG